ncbi:hypothetical protein [Limnobacter sp.]|uniref:hypothetical protein n=1 Tax=Limnobacter sp. TaxID=2003368 RepID=UPI0039194194
METKISSVFALVEVNYFYVSCAPVFNPELEGVPMVLEGIPIMHLQHKMFLLVHPQHQRQLPDYLL